MRAVVASGEGRYADPWHPFAETSRLLAEVVGEAGVECEVKPVDDAVAALAGVDLFVVNAGDPWGEGRSPQPVPDRALATALEAGIGLLSMHMAVGSLRDYPEWAPTVGAMWVPGASFHPDLGETNITGLTLPDGVAVEGFDVVDERYCRLQRFGRSHVVAEHEGEFGPEPTAWVREVGRSRVAVDVLGHDERSYESEGHRRLIAQLVRWATKG